MRKPAVVVLMLALVAVVLSVVVGVGTGALMGGGDDAREFSSPSYPKSADSLPMLISDVSESAPGRSIAVVENAGMFSDGYVVFGADSDRVRNVPEVSDRLDPDMSSASTQLSPDGRLLAIGDLAGAIGDTIVVDLTTGSSRRYPQSAGIVEVLAWSPDSKRLAISWGGSLSVLDVETGTSTSIAVRSTGSTARTDLLPGESPVPDSGGPVPESVDLMNGDRAAFSPDGRSIAWDDGVDIEVFSLDGSGSAPVLLTDKAVWLAGAAAWSPDGKSVLVTRDETSDVDGSTSLLSIDVATRTATRLTSFDYMDFSMPTPVGWRGPSEVLLSGTDANGSLVVNAYGLDGKHHGQLMSFGYSTYSAGFASGLLSSAVARDGGFSGGPTPTWWRVTAGSLAGIGTAVVCLFVGAAVGVPLLVRRRSASRRTALPVVAGWPGAAPVPVAAWPPPIVPAAWPPPVRPPVGSPVAPAAVGVLPVAPPLALPHPMTPGPGVPGPQPEGADWALPR